VALEKVGFFCLGDTDKGGIFKRRDIDKGETLTKTGDVEWLKFKEIL
jgi:hypothetical protein